MSEIFTSFKKVTKAYNKVRGELIRMGVLWRESRLDQIPCLYEPVDLKAVICGWMGYYQDDKTIHFPAWYLPIPFLRGRKNSASDVLRHEFGHALADLYPKVLKKGGLFRKAFGGVYASTPARGTNPKNWEGRCVSGYAATATQEDFAETFMLFMKYKGEIPAKFAECPAIVKKWEAVREIIRRVAEEQE